MLGLYIYTHSIAAATIVWELGYHCHAVAFTITWEMACSLGIVVGRRNIQEFGRMEPVVWMEEVDSISIRYWS